MEHDEEASLTIPLSEHRKEMELMMDRIRTMQMQYDSAVSHKRAALRRAEAAEKLNHTLVEKLRNLPL